MNQKGITLVELLAALALVGTIAAVAWTALAIGFRHSELETSKTQLQQDANFILTTLTNVHRQSDHYYLRFRDSGLEVKSCTETACEAFKRVTDKDYLYSGSVNGTDFANLDPNRKMEPEKEHVEVSLTVTDPENPKNKVAVTTTLTRILTSLK